MASNLPVKAATTYMGRGNRPAQEDHIVLNEEKGIFILADGFGGPRSGKQASQLGSQSIEEFLKREARDPDATLPFVLKRYFSLAGNILFNATLYANQKLIQANQKKNINERGGASVVAGFIEGDLLAIASVGACSAWLIREGKAKELVLPKTLERSSHPFDESLVGTPLMALGMTDDLEPEITEYRLRPGDWLLFHNPALSSEYRNQLIEMQGSKSGNPQDLAREAASLINSIESGYNLSISLVMF